MLTQYAFLTVLFSEQNRISLEIPGMRLGMAEERLTAAFGKRVQIGNSLKELPVIVFASGVSLDDLKTHLAWSVNGEWEEKGDSWLLTQSESQRREEKQIHDRLELEKLSAVIQDAKKRVAEAPEFDAKFAKEVSDKIAEITNAVGQSPNFGPSTQRAELTKYQRMEPIERFRDQFVANCPPEILVQLLDKNQRIVFSNVPTKTQAKLGFDLAPLFKALVEEQQTYRSVTGTNPNNGLRVTFSGNFFFAPVQPPREGSGPRFDRVVLLPATRTVPAIEIVFLDDAGQTIARVPIQLSLNQMDPSDEKRMFSKAMFRSLPQTSPLSKEATMFNSAMAQGNLRKSVPADFIKTLANVTKRDFISYSIAENLRKSTEGRQLIMAVRAEDISLRNPSLVSQLIKRKYDWKEPDNWTVIRPADLWHWKQTEPRRSTLEAIATTLLMDPESRLDTRAKVAGLVPLVNNTGAFFTSWNQAFQSELGPNDNRLALRVWNQLNPEHKRQIQSLAPDNFVRFQFGKLSTGIQKEISNVVYLGPNSLSFSPISRAEIDFRKSEPTELFPDGIDPKQPLTVKKSIQKTISYQVSLPNGDRSWGLVPPSDLAMELFMIKRMPSGTEQSTQPTSDDLFVGETTTYEFSLGNIKWFVSDLSLDRSKKYKPDSLPEPYASEFKKGAERVNQFKARNPVGGPIILPGNQFFKVPPPTP